jgi:AcrR family transcriptional regulator
MSPLVSDEYLKARRDHIIEAAVRCFIAKGFSRTTMQDIFAEAALSPGAVYNYFAGKNDIVVAMAERSLVQNRQAIEIVVNASPTPLTALMDFLFGELAHDERVVASIGLNLEFFAEAPRDPRLAEVLHTQSQALLGLIAEVVRREQATGSVRSDVDAWAVAEVVISLWYGVFLGRVAAPEASMRDYTAVVSAAFHGGLDGRG